MLDAARVALPEQLPEPLSCRVVEQGLRCAPDEIRFVDAEDLPELGVGVKNATVRRNGRDCLRGGVDDRPVSASELAQLLLGREPSVMSRRLTTMPPTAVSSRLVAVDSTQRQDPSAATARATVVRVPPR